MDSKQESDNSMGVRIEGLVDIINGDAEIENLGDLVDEGLMGRTMTTRRIMDEPQEPRKSRLRPRRVSRRRDRSGDDAGSSSLPRRRGRKLRRRPSSQRRAASEPGTAPGGLPSGPNAQDGSEMPWASPGATTGEPSPKSRGRVRQRPRRRMLPREGESPIARYGTIPIRVGEGVESDDCVERKIDDLLGEEFDDYDGDLAYDRDDEPREDDIQTEDHYTFYQSGKEVISFEKTGEFADEGYYLVKAKGAGGVYDDMWDAINAHMDATSYFPGVWFISDHGNAHLMVDPRTTESISVGEAFTFDDLMAVDTPSGDELAAMPLSRIANLISSDWKKVNFAAVPYLRSMGSLRSISDYDMNDPGSMVVNYFLVNAGQWRGPVAKAVKVELKRRLKVGDDFGEAVFGNENQSHFDPLSTDVKAHVDYYLAQQQPWRSVAVDSANLEQAGIYFDVVSSMENIIGRSPDKRSW